MAVLSVVYEDKLTIAE